jgi:hypothetical protein
MQRARQAKPARAVNGFHASTPELPWFLADHTADVIRLSRDESWSPKKTSDTTQTTAIKTRMSPYSIRPCPD